MENFVIALSQHAGDYYNSQDLGMLNNAKTIKFDLADDMDFEIRTDSFLPDELKKNAMIYRPGTEWGGLVTSVSYDEKDEEITWTGVTARGLANMFIIEPPAGSVYATYSGDANDVIRKVLGGQVTNSPIYIFEGSQEDAGFSITATFRYDSLLKGLERALKKVGARLDITFKSYAGAAFASDGRGVQIVLSAVKVKDYTNKIKDASEDSVNAFFTVAQDWIGITRLICLGKGTGTERLVVTLYYWRDGTVHTEPESMITFDDPYSIFGQTAVYDYDTIDDRAELIEKGTQQLLSLVPGRYVSLDSYSPEAEIAIGDTVGAYDPLEGDILTTSITNKILTVSGGTEKIAYSTLKGGDTDGNSHH